jgi:hypothetical protein
MTWHAWLEQWGMGSLRVKTRYLELSFEPTEVDRHAAWALYVELVTRVTTHALEDAAGDEAAALESIYSLFPLTRTVLRSSYGADQFARIAVVVLNQIVRPFTAKWHPLSLTGALENDDKRQEFRNELSQLQIVLVRFTGMLAEMAAVENLLDVEGLD